MQVIPTRGSLISPFNTPRLQVQKGEKMMEKKSVAPVPPAVGLGSGQNYEPLGICL